MFLEKQTINRLLGKHFRADTKWLLLYRQHFQMHFHEWKLMCFVIIWLRFVSKGLINTLRPRQNGQHFADDIFKRIFSNENVRILIKISLKFVPRGPVYNIPALVQIMAWRHPGDKPLSEPMMDSLPTHMCVTRPQWVNNKPALVQIMKQGWPRCLMSYAIT